MYIAHFYKYAFVGIMLDWIREGMKTDPQRIVDGVSVVVHGSIRNALEGYRKDKHMLLIY